MPRRLDIDREATRVLVVAVGPREAARRMGLRESTVMQWSARGKWLADVGKPKQLPPASMQAQAVSNVSTPAEALADSLADMSAGTRLNLARALLNGSAHAARLDGAEVLDKAVPLGHLTRSAASVHTWSERGRERVRINVLTGVGHVQVIADADGAETEPEQENLESIGQR